MNILKYKTYSLGIVCVSELTVYEGEISLFF